MHLHANSGVELFVCFRRFYNSVCNCLGLKTICTVIGVLESHRLPSSGVRSTPNVSLTVKFESSLEIAMNSNEFACRKQGYLPRRQGIATRFDSTHMNDGKLFSSVFVEDITIQFERHTNTIYGTESLSLIRTIQFFEKDLSRSVLLCQLTRECIKMFQDLKLERS